MKFHVAQESMGTIKWLPNKAVYSHWTMGITQDPVKQCI